MSWADEMSAADFRAEVLAKLDRIVELLEALVQPSFQGGAATPETWKWGKGEKGEQHGD